MAEDFRDLLISCSFEFLLTSFLPKHIRKLDIFGTT